MKRKVGLFLLAVMVAVSLGAIIVTSLAMYRLASQRYAEEIRKIEASLSDRFAVFQAMLSDQHERITSHMEKVLPAIAQELEATGRAPGDLSSDELTALAQPARRAAHLLHQSLARRLPDQPARRHEPRLPQGAIHRVPRFGVRRQPGDERRHRHQPGHGNAQDLQLLRAQGQRLHHRDLDRRPRQPRRDRLRLDGEILLRRIADRPDTLESVGQGARHLPDQPGRHLVADPSRPEARSGPGRAHHQEPSRGDQQRRWPLSHHLQRRADRVGDPARPSGDRQARDPQDHLRRRAGARRRSSRSS